MPFQKGDDPNRLAPEKARAAKRTSTTEYTAPPDDGASDELQIMRHVYLNKKNHDRTEPQRLARDIRDKSPAQFLALKAQLEREHEEKKVKAVEKESGPVDAEMGPDAGAERAMDLCRALIKEAAQRAKS